MNEHNPFINPPLSYSFNALRRLSMIGFKVVDRQAVYQRILQSSYKSTK